MRKTDSCFICGFFQWIKRSYSSALQAVELLKEEYEDPEIYVLIQKLQVLGRAFSIGSCKIEKEGKSIEETLEWLESNYLKVHSWVTVDDLKYLERGGRISKASATLGSLLSVKPIITVDKEGRLTNVDKVRGRNKSIQTIVNETVKQSLHHLIKSFMWLTLGI